MSYIIGSLEKDFGANIRFFTATVYESTVDILYTVESVLALTLILKTHLPSTPLIAFLYYTIL